MSTILALIRSPSPDDTSNHKRLLKHSLVEFCATTIFVYFGTLSAVSTGTKLGGGSGNGEDVARIFPIAFSFGITIMALAYAIGHMTGGHMNPGVSLLMFFERQMSFTKMICYWSAQFLGAILASFLVWGSVSGLTGEDGIESAPFLLGSTTLDGKITMGNGFLLELMGSFFFYFVISKTALDKKGIADTGLPAIPIGFSLVVVHICLIPFTGCGVNPARTFGPAVVVCISGNGACSQAIGEWWWIYFAGPFVAAFLVAELTNILNWDVGEDNNYDVAKQVEHDNLNLKKDADADAYIFKEGREL